MISHLSKQMEAEKFTIKGNPLKKLVEIFQLHGHFLKKGKKKKKLMKRNPKCFIIVLKTSYSVLKLKTI